MEKKRNAELKDEAPLELLVYDRAGVMFKSKKITSGPRVIAICVDNCAWMLVKIYSLGSTPEKLLEGVRCFSVQSVRYPTESDYQKLAEVSDKVKETIAFLRSKNVRVANFLKSEFDVLKSFMEKRTSNCGIRLVFDLEKLL